MGVEIIVRKCASLSGSLKQRKGIELVLHIPSHSFAKPDSGGEREQYCPRRVFMEIIIV